MEQKTAPTATDSDDFDHPLPVGTVLHREEGDRKLAIVILDSFHHETAGLRYETFDCFSAKSGTVVRTKWSINALVDKRGFEIFIPEQDDGPELRRVKRDDPSYPPNIKGRATHVFIKEYRESGDETKFWDYGPLLHGISAYPQGEGYELKVFQDEAAVKRNHAPAFRLHVDRLHLGGAFLDGLSDALRLEDLKSLQVRYTETHGYTAYLGLHRVNRQGERI